MKKCKLCDKSLPKSRISSDYCLPCEAKIDEWVRISKAAQEKTLKDKLDEQKEQIVKQAQENFQEVIKGGETLIKEISTAGERFFQDLSKQLFETKKKKKK